jgi:catechol 2,3-dioxygenase-like lactoylglutathione lyase family enzyme
MSRHAWRLAVTLAVGAAVMPATAVAAPSEGTVMRRATLVVHDIAASIAFYKLLGFEKWLDAPPGTVSGQGLPVEGVKVGDPTRLVIMKGKHPYIGMIGLLQYGAPKSPPVVGKMRAGDAIMMIETDQIDARAERLKAGGYRIHKMPETSRIQSVDDAWDAKFMMLFDPDGNMVELTERLN